MRTKLFVSSVCFILLLCTANCRINQRARSEALVKQATNADADSVKLHAKVHELRAHIDSLMAEFEAGKATDVASKVSKLQMEAEKLETQADGLKSELRYLAGKIMRPSDGE